MRYALNTIVLFFMLGIWSCAKESPSQESQPDISSESSPTLPDAYFNYADVALPDFYLENDFPNNSPFQYAAIEADNTPNDNPTTDAGATLGRVLFYDKKLSANGQIACASCHRQDHGFADPMVLSQGFEGGDTRRHSMGLANARFYQSGKFFWDERAATLEEQVLEPFQDAVEMGLTLEELEAITAAQSYYPPLFEDAFGTEEIDSERISLALAQFIRSMVSVTSSYDVARAAVDSPNDDFPAFTQQENLGKSLFFMPRQLASGDVVNCAGCHATEAFIGAIAASPNATTDATNNGLDAQSTDDLGVFETTGSNVDRGKFKVPSLKNIGVRPPYMHDGRFANLEEVVEHYSSGVQSHPQLAPQLVGDDGETLQFDFTEEEKEALVAFLHTLTDEAMIQGEKFSDPFQP